MPRFCLEGKDLKVVSLASGSSGNAYAVVHNKQAILLDAGLSGKKISAGLVQMGIDTAWIKAILITHEHNDHIAGAGVICRRWRLPMYMTAGTWAVAQNKLGKIPSQGIKLLKQDESFVLGDMEITAMPICHDAREPVNYVFSTGKRKAAVLTDTGCITRDMLKMLEGCHALVLEANHDVEMLETGPYPWPLKQRIASRQGHLSNLQAARVATWLAVNGNLRRMMLGHLSAINNTPKVAREAVMAYLVEQNLGEEPLCIDLQVLPRHQVGPVLQVK